MSSASSLGSSGGQEFSRSSVMKPGEEIFPSVTLPCAPINVFVLLNSHSSFKHYSLSHSSVPVMRSGPNVTILPSLLLPSGFYM